MLPGIINDKQAVQEIVIVRYANCGSGKSPRAHPHRKFPATSTELLTVWPSARQEPEGTFVTNLVSTVLITHNFAIEHSRKYGERRIPCHSFTGFIPWAALLQPVIRPCRTHPSFITFPIFHPLLLSFLLSLPLPMPPLDLFSRVCGPFRRPEYKLPSSVSLHE